MRRRVTRSEKWLCGTLLAAGVALVGTYEHHRRAVVFRANEKRCHQISVGMTIDDVHRIMGRPVEVAENRVDVGRRTEWYANVWGASDQVRIAYDVKTGKVAQVYCGS